MSNIEEDKERLMKSLNYELDKIMTRSRKVETATEILNLRQPITYMFLNLLAEREQDKKRIKELEEENAILRKANNITKDLTKEVKIEDITHVMNKSYEEFMKQFVSKQKVKDKIEEINKEYEDSKDENGESEYYYPDYTIRKFKELLEEK